MTNPTAAVYAKTLGEHEHAFLAQHFDPNVEVELETRGELSRHILAVVRRPYVSVRGIKQHAKAIVRLSNGQFNHVAVLSLLIKLMGYHSWQDARHHFVVRTGVTSKRSEALLLITNRMPEHERQQFTIATLQQELPNK